MSMAWLALVYKKEREQREAEVKVKLRLDGRKQRKRSDKTKFKANVEPKGKRRFPGCIVGGKRLRSCIWRGADRVLRADNLSKDLAMVMELSVNADTLCLSDLESEDNEVVNGVVENKDVADENGDNGGQQVVVVVHNEEDGVVAAAKEGITWNTDQISLSLCVRVCLESIVSVWRPS